MTDHLVIPDSHANPRFNNNRFKYVSTYIKRHQPGVIVCMGDLADMDSLCSYDRGKRAFEGRRYKKDIGAANQALEFLDNGYQNVRGYKPRKIFIVGNHENRIDKATQLNPELHGTISIDDIKLRAHGWEVVPFLTIRNVDGVHYSHYFTSGVMGRPIGGENPAAALLKRNYVSCTGAHSHLLDFAERTLPAGRKIMGLVAGCLVDYNMDYAHATQHMWWSGITHKRDVKQGQYDLETISMQRLKRLYS